MPKLKSFRVLWGAVLLCLLVCALSGCANMRARNAQTRYIHEQTARHRYAIGCDRVLPVVRKILFDDGFSVKTVDPGSQTLETEWLLVDRDEQGSTEERYLIQTSSPAANTCDLVINRNRADQNGVDTERDLQFEWVVLQRVDPPSAERITTEAEAIYFSNGGS